MRRFRRERRGTRVRRRPATKTQGSRREFPVRCRRWLTACPSSTAAEACPGGSLKAGRPWGWSCARQTRHRQAPKTPLDAATRADNGPIGIGSWFRLCASRLRGGRPWVAKIRVKQSQKAVVGRWWYGQSQSPPVEIAHRAKQSQLAGGCGPVSKQESVGRPHPTRKTSGEDAQPTRGNCAKQTQFRVGGLDPGTTCTNKANRGDACRAEQSQFAGGRGHIESQSGDWRSRSPIRRRRSAHRAKQSQFTIPGLAGTMAQADRGSVMVSRHGQDARGTHGRDAHATKRPGDILLFPAVPYSIVPPFRPDANCAKQTQFGPSQGRVKFFVTKRL
jgi:hypothetical protein